MITNLKYCVILFVLFSATACNITKVVPENKQLLVHHKIDRGDSKGVDLSDERDNLKPKPNRKLLGFIRFHLWAYQYGNKGLGLRKKKAWHRRLAEKIGEAPVLVDSAKINISASKLSDYYFSKGFLDNKVTYNVNSRKILGIIEMKKRAVITYDVDLQSYHIINSVKHNATSRVIDLLIEENKNKQLIDSNQRLDLEKIEQERGRLTGMLRNNGFFYFNSSYIDFQIDTNQNYLKADIVVNIRNKKNYEPHYQQTIEKVIVMIGNGANQDTLHYDGLNFIQGVYYIKPYALAKNIVLRPGELYNASKVQKSYSNLLSMGLFNFVTIRFIRSKVDSLESLVAQIELQTAAKHDFTWEPQVITTEQSNGIQSNSEPNFGIANNIVLRNRNVFGGAESFNLSAFTALETQLKKDGLGTFYNFRQSITAEFVVPSLVYFERKDFSENLIRKSTKFNASYLHDRNINYTRNVFPFNFTYNFTHEKIAYRLTPFRLSVNQAAVESDFLASLDSETRFYTTQLLTNNIIAGPTAFLYWNSIDKNPEKYWVVRSNAVELSGNLLSLYYRLFTQTQGINKEVLGIKYSQYFRSDFDAVFNHIIDENNSLAYRLYAGAGIPYGNTRFLPYERRFFVGGGNSLRAWRPRTIGPGSFSDSASSVSIEKTGEMMLQGNVEFRFDIIDKYLDGAVFLDAGNMWNFREDDNFKNAEFKFNRFYKEIAINSGVGLRFDFTYIVFRIDWGVALHDPSYAERNRWVVKDFFKKGWVNDNSAVNFAVGYPFLT